MTANSAKNNVTREIPRAMCFTTDEFEMYQQLKLEKREHEQRATASSAAASSTSASESYVEKFSYTIFENVEYPHCADISKYEFFRGNKIGQGTFGEVYKTINKETHEKVALKRILTDKETEGFPITALREINILSKLKHENIVNLIEVCTTKATSQNGFRTEYYLVFERCDHDLAGLLSHQRVKFRLNEIKSIMKQLLNGLFYIHKNNFLHRDMKTSNILVKQDGTLKIADFGLARAVDTQLNRNMTNRVVTLWYRPPELLLGERHYTSAIDMWGAGCIMAELWTRSPIMQGSVEQHQLILISQLCGSIEPSVWPNVVKLDLFRKIELPKGFKRRVIELMRPYVRVESALTLIDKLLSLDPSQRPDSHSALDFDFFWTEPMPSPIFIDKNLEGQYEMNAPPRIMRPPPPPPSQPQPNQVTKQLQDRIY